MDSYETPWKQSAERDSRRIDRQQIAQIIGGIESLSNDRFSPSIVNFEARRNFIEFG